MIGPLPAVKLFSRHMSHAVWLDAAQNTVPRRASRGR